MADSTPTRPIATIRNAKATDLAELSTLYRETVLCHGPTYYTSAQTQVWAASASDLDHFRQFILGVHTLVATDKTGILGFAGIGETGHVASCYARHDCLHQGIGSQLMQAIVHYAHHQAMARLYAEASEFSLGLFQKFGFRLYDTEIVDRQGVKFNRYLVEITLAP